MTTTQCVVAGARQELRAGEGDTAKVQRLLEQVDLLLARAIVEDGVAERRRRAVGRLTPFLAGEEVPVDGGAAGNPDPSWATTAGRMATVIGVSGAAQSPPEHLARLLEVLVETDLPDAARVRRASQDGTGDPSVNSLGAIEQASISAERVQRYLAARFGEGPLVREVVRLAGGFSKETILVSTEGGDGFGDVVLRKVVPGRPAEHLPFEYAMVSFAWKNGLPVPEPLWLEMDTEALGAPFFATARARGRNAGDVYGPYPGVPRQVALTIASILARLHRLAVDDLGPTPTQPMFTRPQVLEAIGDWEQLLGDLAAPDDLYGLLWRAVLAWLRAHAPEPRTPAVLVHSDVGFHNLLVSGSAVEALLDWERSHLGTAAQDLAYVRPSLTSIIDWPDFLEAYRAAGGHEVDPAALQFYTVWQDTWRGIAALRLRQRFLADSSRLSDAVAGILMHPRFLLTALQSAFGTEFGEPEPPVA